MKTKRAKRFKDHYKSEDEMVKTRKDENPYKTTNNDLEDYVTISKAK